MKRRVLLITNPGVVGADNYCAGVYRDRENYFSYFKQAYGGYWSDNELHYFDKPTKAEVYNQLADLSRDDIEFSIIIFCGHGWYSSKSGSNILTLNDKKEEIDSLDFRIGANKRIIILDSCRKVHDEYLSESARTFGLSASLEKAMKLNPEECKKYYNYKVSRCSKQLINSYGCDIDEFCNDSSTSGGYYSSSLVKAGKNWADSALERNYDINKTAYYLSFPSAHDRSIPDVLRLSRDIPQNPQIDKPRADSEDYLPFAVVA